MATTKQGNESEETAKTSFLLRKTLTRKLKVITSTDSKYPSQTVVIDQLLSKFVDDWERKHGEIKLK